MTNIEAPDMSEIRVSEERSEVTIHVGGQSRTLRFRAEQVGKLERALEQDPLTYLTSGRGETVFCNAAILAGLSYDRKATKDLTPADVYRWLDEAKDLDREELMKQVLYTVGRGKTGAQRQRWMKILDQIFSDEPGAKGEPGPSNGG